MTQERINPPEPARMPGYARVLRLRHVRPSGAWCFLYFEGAIALAVLLALAELVSWWAVVALPVTVALMVKLNDLVAGTRRAVTKPPGGGSPRVPPPADSGWSVTPRRTATGERATTSG